MAGEHRLIGNMLPLKEISEGGAIEKRFAHGRLNNMHRWWAAKPTTVSRVVAYSSLVDPPLSEHEAMVKEMCDYADTTGPDKTGARDRARRKILEKYGEPPKVLDPFGGTGALPFSAAWLGCEAYSVEYNPVAVLMEKCVLEFPARYGMKLLKDVKKMAEKVEKMLRERTRQFNPANKDGYQHYAYLWCRSVKCECGMMMPLAYSYLVSKKKGICLYPHMVDGKVKFSIHGGDYDGVPDNFDPKLGSMNKGVATCVGCRRTYTNIEVRDRIQNDQGGEMMMCRVATHVKKRGRFYFEITDDDYHLYEKCAHELEMKRAVVQAKYGVDPLPTGIISTPDGNEYKPGGPVWDANSVVTYGYTRWHQLFNVRQRLALVTLVEIFLELQEDDDKDHAAMMSPYMMMVFDKTVEKYCRLSPWHNMGEMLVHCFGQQKIANAWDYVEGEPSKNWSKSALSVLDGINASLSVGGAPNPNIRHGSATSLPADWTCKFDAVCTDPPYYDSMQYSKTADFFYVWQKIILSKLYPDLYKTVLSPKKDEVVETVSRTRSYNQKYPYMRDADEYQQLMSQALSEMYRVLKDEGILTLVYAHKSTEGWETLIQAMFDAGFTITAAWPMDTETKNRMAALDTASLASSIYMVGRKWKKLPAAGYAKVNQEFKGYVCNKLDYFASNNINGADFYIAAIGAALVVYSKYEKVIRNDGTHISVSDILNQIRGLCSEHVVKTLTTDRVDNVDPLTKLYISWRWAYGDRKVDFDQARKMFTGVGLDMDDYLNVIIKKSGSDMQMLDSKHRAKIKTTDTMVDILHTALQLWHDQNHDKADKLLKEKGCMGNETFNAVCQAISEAGAKSESHAETDESREIHAFISGRKAVLHEKLYGTLERFIGDGTHA